MKKIIFLFTIFLLFSCEVQYDGKRRYIAETTIIDKDGNPLKDIEIEINAGDDLISSTNTDENGYSHQMFPLRENGDTFSIEINSNNNIYQSKSIYNIRESDFEDFVFNFGNITLFKNSDVVNFHIDLKKVTENTSLESLEINAISTDSSIDYNEPEEEYFYPETYYYVIKNQNFTIFYSVRNFATSPSTLTEYSVNVSIGSENLVYELEY